MSAHPRQRARDLTPREYARRYQEAYGTEQNPLVTLFNGICMFLTFILVVVTLFFVTCYLFHIDPSEWFMTHILHQHGAAEQAAPAPPTAFVPIQPQQPAIVVPQPQEQYVPPAALPTAVPQAPQAEQAAPAQAQPPVVPTAVPTALPTALPTAVPTVLKIQSAPAQPMPRGWGGGGSAWIVGTPTPSDGGSHW